MKGNLQIKLVGIYPIGTKSSNTHEEVNWKICHGIKYDFLMQMNIRI